MLHGYVVIVDSRGILVLKTAKVALLFRISRILALSQSVTGEAGVLGVTNYGCSMDV